jgi:carbon monoxide dehydrogenase subunit G
MAEKLVNEFTVNRPIDEAWAVITDVERIAPCLPGAQLQEIEGDIYRGIVKIKLGSITPQFKGQATFLDRDDSAHRAVLKAEGRDTGGRGNASAEITAHAESLSPTATKVIVSTDLAITGKVAQFGRGIIGDVSKKLMDQFAGNLNTMLDREPDAATSSVDGDTDAAEVIEPNGATVRADATPDDATPTTSAPAGSAATSGPVPDGAPKVRKIDSPATEPVDLAGVAGPALLKRIGPVVLGLLLLLVVLRRRR